MGLLLALKGNQNQNVVCTIPNLNSNLRATGVPRHVSILLQMTELTSSVSKIITEIQQIAPDVTEAIADELEKRAVEAGTVTRFGLAELIEIVLRKVELFN